MKGALVIAAGLLSWVLVPDAPWPLYLVFAGIVATTLGWVDTYLANRYPSEEDL